LSAPTPRTPHTSSTSSRSGKRGEDEGDDDDEEEEEEEEERRRRMMMMMMMMTMMVMSPSLPPCLTLSVPSGFVALYVQVRGLHLGHVAKSFALRAPPSAVKVTD
jgi:hypothetical protein